MFTRDIQGYITILSHSIGSPSLLNNNLSISSNTTKLAYIKSNRVVVSEKVKGSTCKSLVLPSREFITIHQLHFVKDTVKDILVVTCDIGVYFYIDFEAEGKLFTLEHIDKSIATLFLEDSFFSAVASSDGIISIGSSWGKIYNFRIQPIREAKVGTLGDSYSFELFGELSTSNGIVTCLSSCSKYIATGNDTGEIFRFTSIEDSVDKSHLFELKFQKYGNNYPCTSICHTEDIIFASYSNGQIKIFRPHIGELAIEVNAHIRSITSLLIHKELNVLLSCSEDQHFKVWSLPDFKSKASSSIELLFSEVISDRILTGMDIIQSAGGVCITCFDDLNIKYFIKSL